MLLTVLLSNLLKVALMDHSLLIVMLIDNASLIFARIDKNLTDRYEKDISNSKQHDLALC